MFDVLAFDKVQSREDARRMVSEQAPGLLSDESDPIARMANLAALIHQATGWHWVGFYRVQGQELVLGPFQGPPACTRIAYGKGVCGSAWAQGRTLVVDDVHSFPGHIACSPHSRSEIVVPLPGPSGILGVLDIDSRRLKDFDREDQRWLEDLVALLMA